eukprot:scaffold41922_cov21-Tisochrysis_lutea.AAC.4
MQVASLKSVARQVVCLWQYDVAVPQIQVVSRPILPSSASFASEDDLPVPLPCTSLAPRSYFVLLLLVAFIL